MKTQTSAILCFFSILFLSLSCGTDSDKATIPENVLAKDKMTAVLKDLHLAEALITDAKISESDSMRIAFANLQKEVFKKHKIDSSLYAKSYQFYAKQPSIFKEMYQAIYKDFHQKDSLIKGNPQELKTQTSHKTNPKIQYPKNINIQEDINAFKKINPQMHEPVKREITKESAERGRSKE